ncbi:hypothetical protein pb186bvf_019361 [Paramecium bursaria]
MNQYSIQLIDIELFDNKYYYKLRISSQQSTFFRDLKVKYSDLLNLHSKLQGDNYASQLPPFPERSMMKMFSSSDTKEELEENRKLISMYLQQISKQIILNENIQSRSPPNRYDPILQFINNTFDPQRVKELKFAQITKEQLYQLYSKTTTLKKGDFQNVQRVTYDKTQLAMHIYKLPQVDQAKNDFEAYRRAALLIDYPSIIKIYEIGIINKNKGWTKSWFGQKNKPTVYTKLGIDLNINYDKYYSIEELCEQPINEIISLRQVNSQYFELDILSDAIMTLANFYTTSNLFWSEKQGFKIGCISPIMIFKKKYKTKVANDPEYLTLTPPEQLNQYPNKQMIPMRNEVWQIGVIILSMATLTQVKDLGSLELLNEKLKVISFNYGENLANLVKMMLERNPNDRLTVQEIINNHQTIIQTKFTYFNNKPQEQRKVKLRIISLSTLELDQIDKLFKEKSHQSIYYVNMILDKPVIQYLILYLERMKKENIRQLQLNLETYDFGENLEKILKILIDYKGLQNLLLNFKGSKLLSLQPILRLNESQTLKYLALDLVRCSIDISQLRDLKMKNQIYI